MAKVGAPARRSNDEIAQALNETGGMIAITAKRLGYSYNALAKRVKASPRLQEIILASREELVDISEIGIKTAALNREPWALMHISKTLGKNRGYTERQEVTGADGGAIEVIRVRRNQDDD